MTGRDLACTYAEKNGLAGLDAGCQYFHPVMMVGLPIWWPEYSSPFSGSRSSHGRCGAISNSRQPSAALLNLFRGQCQRAADLLSAGPGQPQLDPFTG